jgi:hypothetical protein
MVELSNVPHEDLRHLEEIFALLTPRDQEILDALNAQPDPKLAYIPKIAHRD